jgi:hypothetical protein
MLQQKTGKVEEHNTRGRKHQGRSRLTGTGTKWWILFILEYDEAVSGEGVFCHPELRSIVSGTPLTVPRKKVLLMLIDEA